ncbi:MAG: 50S ribosomal protein L6 [Gammaproteobacteria bacterium]
MSRVAESPVPVPKSVQVTITDADDVIRVSVKGPKGEQALTVHPMVKASLVESQIRVEPKNANEKKGSPAWTQAGTARALLMNLVLGVEKGFERRLQLTGVGYRAQAKEKTLSLTVGHSHPVNMPVPDGIHVETPTQTEIVLSGIDKQVLGQFAANIRSVRPPEPYKGKGIRYANEQVRTKEAKKK